MRSYRWAYVEKRPAEDLAALLDPSLAFNESRTRAALALRGGNQSKGGLDSYVARRDRFVKAFPDMTHALLSLDVSDDGAQVRARRVPLYPHVLPAARCAPAPAALGPVACARDRAKPLPIL